MSKFAEANLSDEPLLNNTFSRRDFVRSGAMAAGAMADSRIVSALFEGRHSTDETSPIRMGLASYTFCQQVSRQHNLDIQLQAGELPLELPDDLSLCFYRVAQEALNNAVKHSHSTRVEVKLGDSGGQVWMRIKDFGVGFDSTARANGIGLAAMRERLRMVGGSLRVKSSPGVGTELTAEAKPMTPATSSHLA